MSDRTQAQIEPYSILLETSLWSRMTWIHKSTLAGSGSSPSNMTIWFRCFYYTYRYCERLAPGHNPNIMTRPLFPKYIVSFI